MKLPGVSLLAERRAVNDFERQDRAFRELVFYSESSGDWPHVGPIIRQLLDSHGRKISYLASDASDPGLSIEHPGLRAFHIGSGTHRTILFARIDCRHFAMTLPDLGKLWLKRSVHRVHYVYLFHSMNSTHTSYRKGAFDGFDTILCVGPYHVDEIRRTEELYGLPAKNLVQHGSVKLDTVIREIAGMEASDASGPPQVLVAPTWGESSLIEQPVGRALIDVLLGAGQRMVLRLHPMTVRRLPDLVEELRRAYGGSPGIGLEDDMSATASWLRADLMVSDWSGAAIEFAFALGKPVVYVDTSPKIMNHDWEQLGMPSFESRIRDEIGIVVDPRRIEGVPAAIGAALADRDGVRERAFAARDRWVFNPGRSVEAAAEYFASLSADR